MDPRPDASDTIPADPAVRPPAAYPFLSPPDLPDEIGRLGPFRVLAELGRGGMGVVFRAEEVGLKRQVALKVMLPAAAASTDAVARFRREAEAQAKVEHDHIIPIYRVDEANGVPFLAMPLLKGQTLGAALKLSRCPPMAEIVRIGAEMAEGLAAAHDAGLIHRDIKPANVWLEGNKRRVKILDFGLARVAHAPAAEGEPTVGAPVSSETAPDSTQLTAAGAIMGTPAYMSPEQARGQPTDARTDLFALGVVLYEMAAGRKPFTGPSSMDVMAAVVTLHPQPPHELNPEVPERLTELIRRLMAKDASQRPATAAEVAEELETIGRGLDPLPVVVMPVGEVPGAPNPWADIADTEVASEAAPGRSAAMPALRPAKSRKPLVFAAFTLLLAGAIVAAVVVAMTRDKKPRDADPPPEVVTPKKDGPAPKPTGAPASGTVPPAFFNGRDLSGWKVSGNRGVWEVNNGTITWAYREDGTGPYSYLTSDRAFGDFELSFLFRHTGERLNPLGFLLTFRAEEGTKGAHHLNFAPDRAAFKTSKVKAAAIDGSYQVRLRCVGKKATAVVNGETLVDEEIDMPSRGTLIWHNVSSFKGAVAISDIKFTDLSQPLGGAFFSGKDLSGWKIAGPGGDAGWRAADGTIVGERPEHTLSTRRVFADFELSFQIALAEPVAGGLEFRFRHDSSRGAGIYFDATGVMVGARKGKAMMPVRAGFNDVTLRCVGSRVTATVNGARLCDEDYVLPPQGVFILHGSGGLAGVTIKDIRFTDLTDAAKK